MSLMYLNILSMAVVNICFVFALVLNIGSNSLFMFNQIVCSD